MRTGIRGSGLSLCLHSTSLCCEQETSVEGRLYSHLYASSGRHSVRGQSGRQQGELGHLSWIVADGVE